MDSEPSFDESNFVVTQSNQDAFEHITMWPEWANNIVLSGDAGVGKSHLAHIWLKRSNGIRLDLDEINTKIIEKYKNVLIEDIDSNQINHHNLFHVINLVKEIEGFLLLTSKISPTSLITKIPDLNSRIRSFSPVKINKPDDYLLEIMILKIFSDKNIMVDEKVIKFLLKRVERSISGIILLIQKINEKSLEEKRPITVPLVSELINSSEDNE
jgi:chromosomal replication initiation ATPase DnaA